MLTARDELQYYLECIGLDEFTRQQITGGLHTASQAEAILTALQAAEAVGASEQRAEIEAKLQD